MGEGDNNGHVIDIPEQAHERRVVLHRVATQVARDEGRSQLYEPVLVSLGPFHHDRLRFENVEALKGEILDDSLQLAGRGKLLEEILSRVGDIRSFYGGLSPDEYEYSDAELADMMLRDACFLAYFMKNMGADDENCIIRRCLGMSRVAFVVRDFFMLENQLPFWILKLLMIAAFNKFDVQACDHDDPDHGSNGCEAFFFELLSSMISCEKDLDRQGTLHLLDARRTTLVHSNKMSPETNQTNSKKKVMMKKTKSQFRSVTDLKGKGIHFRPSSHCLKDIEFSSHSFYGKLRLPVLSMDNNTNVIFSNMIALEMSPGSRTDFTVISYVKFMKTLIEKAEDVKELREKGIILSCLANDEAVVKMFKEFNTDGSCAKDIFRDIRERINDHCSSKAKTFKAELIHTYFRSPWTAMALFVATLLLFVNCFNFFLNYHRMRRPMKRD